VAPRDFRTRLARRAGKAGLFVTDELAERLSAYIDLLSRWNRKINLTSLDHPDEVVDRLLLEPLAAARYLAVSSGTLMDVGSGGGSPAIPLKLAAPALRLMMVEVKARKSAFLREAVRNLELTDTVVETARYEELLARPELHETFDLLTMRAIRIESRTLTTLQAFVKPGGDILLFRGPAGPIAPPAIVPPLEWRATHSLIDSLQSRLTILGKRSVGVFHVKHSLGPPAPSR
jgi:16S rRNA (guanine527-N7)-methyltransferase